MIETSDDIETPDDIKTFDDIKTPQRGVSTGGR